MKNLITRIEEKYWTKERRLKSLMNDHRKLMKFKEKFESNRRIFGALVAIYNRDYNVDLWNDNQWFDVKDETLFYTILNYRKN